MSKNIVVVGAGLVGSMLACYLSKRGHKVSVYERRPDMRAGGYIGGRSINLALSHRGWKSLRKMGIEETVAKIAIPMRGRMIHDTAGNTNLLPYGQKSQAIYSVSRGELNKILVEEAEKFPDVKFFFNQRCSAVNFDKSLLTFEDLVHSKYNQVHADLVFGADGAYSEVRYEMQKTPNFNISQQHEQYGYKELEIPAGEEGKHLIEKNALHIWPRKSFMMIALPNLDGSFTVTLFAPFTGDNSFENIQTERDVEEYFGRNFPDAVLLMPDLKKNFFDNPTSSLVTVKCFPWKYHHFCLIGDAAHAVVPFYGQGMNCGFEDVRELDEILDDIGEDWNKSLDRFQRQRKSNADAIADLALGNFIEMRDLSGREDFQLRSKIEKRIAEKFHDKFMTHYSMVTFSDLSYSDAKKRGEKQSELLDKIMSLPGIDKKWDSLEVMNMADDWIKAHQD